MTRRKHHDPVASSKFTFSHQLPYNRELDWQQRHRRRYEAAVSNLSSVAAWCEYRNVAFMRKQCRGEFGWHAEVWDFRHPDRFAQWWPARGHLALKRNLRGGLLYRIKVYDHEQLLMMLAWWLTDEPRPTERLDP